MCRAMPSLRSLSVAGLWRTSLLTTTTTWGKSDSAIDLETSALDNARRTYNGTGNNIAQPKWGSVGQRQLRSVAGASYYDRVSTPPGEDRPTPRKVLSDVFLSTPPSSSTTSALFVGWGLLVGYDLFLNRDNASEPLDIACDDASLADGWCRLGSLSGPISFNRSQGEIDAEGDGARSPTNYATAYIDLDWLYGRDEESAAALRTLDEGNLNLTADGLPHLLPDGTWLVTDQRPTRMPVTFALMTLLLREHNRCCNEMAPAWHADTDEDAYQVCRQWTIAVFQHISENEFSERLVGGSARYLGSAAFNFFYNDDMNDNTGDARRPQRRLSAMEIIVRSRYLARMSGSYDAGTNAGVDTVFSTVANPAFYSALPSTVGLLDDNYDTIDEHGIELAAASADMAGLIERIGGIESIVRGAANSHAQAVDVSVMPKALTSPALLSLPAVAIQRGRDHGIPSYNDVREACGFSRITTFEDITSDDTVQGLLADTYSDVELLDAYTGALAENEDGSGLFAGPLLRAVFLEQMYRAIVGDRHYHSHNSLNEDTKLSTLGGLILDNSLVSSIPLDTFAATDTVVSSTTSATETSEAEFKEVFLADWFKMAWNGTGETDNELMHMTISAKGIDMEGMIAVGFGGDAMENTGDFVICVVSAESLANCTDHSQPEGHGKPPYDDEDSPGLEVVNVTSDGEWTSVTFVRLGSGDDDSDYSLTNDIASGDDTPVIYAWSSGEGISKHLTTQRGDVLVNFADGTLTYTCDGSSDYYALHGALLLVAWLLFAPYGIYQARYRKGTTTLIGKLWWEMHEECMVICAEALLPLAITAIFTTGGQHDSSHAKWGFYMIGAIVLQIVTGWARARALSGKSNNFSRFHRANKHFHIYAGWFAYISGLVQCYRGLELVAGSDALVFSAAELNFSLGSFDIVKNILFPVWIVIVPPVFVVLEVRKQFTRYFRKGAANLCGMVELINEEFADEALKKEVEDRLMPRTEELPLYTTHEFNAKILNGRSWVIVDGAVLDVGAFVKRHPGGARVLMNVMGTDVTSEIIGEDASIGNSGMTFNPHTHSDIALEIARSLIVGYIEEEDDMETDRSDDDEDSGGASSGPDLGFFNRSFLHSRRISSLSGSDSEANDKRGLSRIPHRSSRHFARVPLGRGKSAHPGRLASWPGPTSSGDEVESKRSFEGGRKGSGRKPRSRRIGGGSGGSGSGSGSCAIDEQRRSFSSDGSADGEHRKQLIVSDGKTKKLPAGVLPVGAAVTLSAKAAAIMNAESPPAARPELSVSGKKGVEAERRSGIGARGQKGTGAEKKSDVGPSGQTEMEAEGKKDVGTSGQNGTGVEAKGDVAPAVSVDNSELELSPSTPVSPLPVRWQKRLSTHSGSLKNPAETKRPSARSISFNRPVELNHPVVMNTTSNSPSSAKPTVTGKRLKTHPVRRILGRIGSQISMSGASGDESDFRQEDRPFKAMRRVWEKKNLLDFFHVCPLLLHERMGDGGGRPVHKFVFACPGRAGALVDAMEGVCHFRMRAAKEAGMTVVQRSYNAFAVRVQGEEGTERRVVPAGETDEGELCIEMRIRLYPDGLMSSLLLQLIKNFDNPAVQLQGPFLQDRLIPPPSHRNVVMIAAGTGVNPMVQMIRDYLNPDSHHGVLLGAHSRLVLLWQNNDEEDLFCADELTLLQAKAKGLLEVTAILSGDKTRRNVPGNAFRRAKARLVKQGMKSGLVSSGAGATGDTDIEGGAAHDQTSGRATPSRAGGSSEFKNEDEDGHDNEVITSARLRRHKLARALSRVTEEDCMSRGSSFVNSTRTFGGRDLESGGGSSFRSPMTLYEGSEESKPAGVGSDVGKKSVPWSPICGDKTEWSAGDGDRITNAPNGGREKRGGSPRGKESEQSTSRIDNARGLSIVARSADCSTNVWGEGCRNSGDGDSSAIPVNRRGDEGHNKPSSHAFNRQRAVRNLSDTSSDMSGCVSEGARADRDSSCEEAKRSRVRLGGPFREASAGRGRRPKSASKKEGTGHDHEDGGGSDSVRKAHNARSPVRPTLGRSKSLKVDTMSYYSSSEDIKSDATTVTGGSVRLSRLHRREISKGSPSSQSGLNTHSHPTARRTRHESSRSRPLRNKASEDLAGSPLEDSGSGLQHTKLSKSLIEKAVGPEVMRAIASFKAGAAVGATQEGSAEAAEVSALSSLVGTEARGGALQVVVSGPAGFVFHAEGLLAELGIPPQAVVLLD